MTTASPTPDTSGFPARRVTTQELVALYNLPSPQTIYRCVRAGMPALRFGRDYRFDLAAVENWMAEQARPEQVDPLPPPRRAPLVNVDDAWVAEQVDKFTPDDLERAGLILSRLAKEFRAVEPGTHFVLSEFARKVKGQTTAELAADVADDEAMSA